MINYSYSKISIAVIINSSNENGKRSRKYLLQQNFDSNTVIRGNNGRGGGKVKKGREVRCFSRSYRKRSASSPGVTPLLKAVRLVLWE